MIIIAAGKNKCLLLVSPNYLHQVFICKLFFIVCSLMNASSLIAINTGIDCTKEQ